MLMLDSTVCDRPEDGHSKLKLSLPRRVSFVFVILVSASFYCFLSFSPDMFSLSVAVVAQTACLCKYVYHKGLISLRTICL